MRAHTVALALLLLACPAHAEVYRWVDESGAVHFDDDISRVPEAQRPLAQVFRSKAAQVEAPATDSKAPTQGAFAGAIARELGLQTHATQDPVSVLQIVGIYPSAGWNPTAVLSPSVVDEVVQATRAAARARRMRQSTASAEAAVLRVASALGIAAPPPTVVAEPEPPPEPAPPIVVAPNIVVEAPPAVVVYEPAPDLASRVIDPTFAFGIPFATTVPAGPRPPGLPRGRIPPLDNPAGHLSGPVVEPLRGPVVEPLRPAPFTRPRGF